MLSSLSNEDRKRSLALGSDDGPRKRLNASNSVSRSAGVSAGDNDDEDEDSEALHPAYVGLEAFRKEAIYRKLLEARRELQRTERKVLTLQSSLSTSERRAASLERFWTLFLTELAVGLALQDPNAFQLSLSSESQMDATALETELEQRTRALLRIITDRGDVKTEPGVADLQQRYHDLADETSRYKQELFVTQSRLQRAEDALAQTSEKLLRLENEYVRYQSSLIRSAEGKNAPVSDEAAPSSGATAGAPGSADTAAVKKEATEGAEHGDKADSSAALQQAADDLAKANQDLESTRRESDSRYAEIRTLNEEVKALKLQVHTAHAKLENLPEDVLTSSAAYKELQSAVGRNKAETASIRELVQSLESENAKLREERSLFQQTAEAEAGARVEELEKQIRAKDADIVRLRGQRDELNAELTERRQREQVKFSQIEEMKTLLNSKEERLVVLTSQVRRLRITVAALRGQKAAVEALTEAKAEEDQIERLGLMAQAAESQVAELQQRLEAADQANGNKANAGDESLQAEVDRLKLALQAAETSCTAVDDELERVSTAYAELEKQATVKVTDVSRVEEKNLRLVTEKSKADNKFFSAMRAKDALAGQVEASQAAHERQQAIIQGLTENEKSFAAQVILHEKQVSLFRRTVAAHEKKIEELQRVIEVTESRLMEADRVKATTADSAKELISTATEEKDQRKRAEERIARLEKDLESAKRQMAKAAAAARSKGRRETTDTGDSSEKDSLNALLQCSSCKERYRNRILTKCYHTFCNECIDTRVQTRQRKCPHCGLAFAVSDVQPLYLQ